jgi:voltage-gated potassium channel
MRAVQSKLYEILETSTGSRAGRLVNALLIVLIVGNVVAVTMHTVRPFASRYVKQFRAFELVSVAIFSIEYVLRMWVCTRNDSYRRPVLGRIRYFFTPFAIIDLVAVLPFYLPMLIPFDLIFVRALRLMRLLRLLKLGRYSESIRTMGAVVSEKREELGVAVAMSLILLLIASALMYFIEGPAQPEIFSSIPAAMWWGVVTMTTVGYGDVLPVTTAGKILSGLIAVLGIGLFILPAGIIAAGYGAQIRNSRRGRRICPHCGKPIT